MTESRGLPPAPLRPTLPDRRAVLKAGSAFAAVALTGCSDTKSAEAGPDSPPPSASPDRPPSSGPTATDTTTAAPDWSGLARSLKGRLYLPGSSGYAGSHQLFNPRWDTVRPAGVVKAANPADVRKSVLFGRKNNLVCVAKSGGHSYVGAATVNGGLMIDVGAIRGMSYAQDVLTVGAGARLYDVHAFLDEYGRSLPTGTCPTVGIAGLALGGGIGVHTRAFGLTCDRVLSIDAITADGEIRTVSAAADPDLFWALRGVGGGNLGIVTSFRISTIPGTKLGLFRLSWPGSQAAAVIRGWQDFARMAPITSWANLHLDARSNGTIGVRALGVSTTGDATAAAAQLEKLAGARAGSRSITVKTHLEAVEYLGGGITSPRTGFLAGSDVLRGPMDDNTVAAVLGAVRTAAQAKTPATAILDPLGGQAAKEPAGGSAWPWRTALGVIQWYTRIADRPTPAQLRVAQDFVSNGHRAVEKVSAGGYVNYVENGRPVASYYGGNLTRLRAVKQKYDPADFFRGAYTLR